MKIAVIGPAHPYTGGAAQHTTTLAHRLSAAGHQVTLHSWRSLYPRLLYPGQVTVAEPEIELFPHTERRLAWNRPDGWWRTGRRLAADGFDAAVLSVFTPLQVPAYIALAKAARAGGCKVVALCHNVLPHERRGFDTRAMRALFRCADAVIVHSSEEAALAAALTTVPVEMAALALHLPHIDRAASVRGAPRPRANRLLFFGMVRPYKGVDLLLRALAETKPEVSLTIAGEIWAGRDRLLRLISDLRLANRVTMSERYVQADQVPALFAAADALVLPYRSGTASQNALIALAFGVPVIATRAGAIAESVVAGVNGLLCAPGDVKGLARAISTLYEPGMLERLRRGARLPDASQASRAWDRYVATVERAISGRPAGDAEDRPFLPN